MSSTRTYEFDEVDTVNTWGHKVRVHGVQLTSEGDFPPAWYGRELFKNGKPKRNVGVHNLDDADSARLLAQLGIPLATTCQACLLVDVTASHDHD